MSRTPGKTGHCGWSGRSMGGERPVKAAGAGVGVNTRVAAGYLAGFLPSHPVGICRGCKVEEIWELL